MVRNTVVVALSLFLIPLALRGQTTRAAAPVTGALPAEQYVAPRRGFNLFANADRAASGMRMAGTFAWAVSNIGPCAEGHVLYGDGFGCGGFEATGSSTFEIVLSAGVPPTDFQKIRAAHENASTHLGPLGYTNVDSHLRIGGLQDWGPADNSIGRLFSGATSTSDGSCTDDRSRSNNFMNVGVQLLASSDCPPTWPGSGFAGPRRSSEAEFRSLQAFQGNAFTFDYFKIPPASSDTRSLGDFSTYGEISDHFSEVLSRYGRVTPHGGSATPTINGFPLGLDVHFEAYSFTRPQIANASFWQMTVVNNSKDVYGVGIDYDSLYMGLMNGISISSYDHAAQYALPHRNALFAAWNGINAGCNGAITGFAGSVNCSTNGGFRRAHGFGIVMLKSPIGDTRNKLLTRAGPFYNPGSPYADDTITFNHHHQCGFGANCWSSTSGLNDRRGFGMISSTEANVLDGRDPATLPAATLWWTFHSKAIPQQPVFNRYAPGNWSYENKVRPAGISAAQRQDTIFFDDCEGAGAIIVPGQNGDRPLPSCSVAFSDTMPGKQIAGGGGNVGGVMTAGPFPLKAGDTTSFVIAFLGARDSVSFEALADAVTEEYLGFFLGADSPPAPTIAGAEVISAEERHAAKQSPVVRLLFGDQPETWVDPYLTRFASDVRSRPDLYFRRLRSLNPSLADSIDLAARNNFSSLLIFRSCDNGVTFDSRVSCAELPSRSKVPQPYATLNSAIGIPNIWSDSAVLPGMTYLYSLVPVSKGLKFGVIDVDPTDQSPACLGDTTFAACRKAGRILTVADTLMAPVLTEGPSVAKVYVPIALPAGAGSASVAITTRAGNATVPLGVTLTQSPIAGDYRVLFGNRFIILQTMNTQTGAVSVSVRVQSLIAAARRSGVDINDFVEREVLLVGNAPVDLPASYSPTVSTGVGTRSEIDTIFGLGVVLARGTQPLFLSQHLNGSTAADPTTPLSALSRADFPGFVMFVDQLQAIRRLQSTVRRGDTISTASRPSLEFTGTQFSASGKYVFTFLDDPFGHGPPLSLDAPPAQVAAAFASSLAARTVGTIGDTTARMRLLAGFGGLSPARARPIRFPFTVTSATGNPVILVGFSRATTGPDTGSFLLGTGADSLRVSPDSLSWLPGDAFRMLEIVQRDSLVNGRVLLDPTTSQRITQPDTINTFLPVRFGCQTPRSQCNPLASGPGATGYVKLEPQDRIIVEYPVPFSAMSDLEVRIMGRGPFVSFSRKSLDRVRVIPNPFVVQSQYQTTNSAGASEPRLMFSGLPATGRLRIYSVSGQWLQELSWAPGQLEGGTSGDLHWNLRTRNGELVASGLYIFVVTANDEHGKPVTGRGKFVVIR